MFGHVLRISDVFRDMDDRMIDVRAEIANTDIPVMVIMTMPDHVLTFIILLHVKGAIYQYETSSDNHFAL